MIWLIALVPAIVVLLVAIGTESKAATLSAASIAALLGLLTGSPVYAVLDLGAVAVATLFAWNTVTFQAHNPAREATKAAELAAFTKKLDSFNEGVITTFYWIGGISSIAILVWFFLLQQKVPAASTYKPALVSPLQRDIVPVVPVIATPTQSAQVKVPKKKISNKTPMQRCVEIIDEAKMLACLEGLP